MHFAAWKKLVHSKVSLVLMSTFVTMATLGSVVAQQAVAVRIAVEGKFPPFNYLDADGNLQGFDVEVARALCQSAKLSCELVEQNWDDMIPNLLARRYDAIISSMSMSLERQKIVAFTGRYYDSPAVFIGKKASSLPDFRSRSLGGLSLGVTHGTVQADYIAHFYQDAKVTVFPASPDLYEGMAEGSVDIVFEDKLAIYDWLANTKAGACCEFKGLDIVDATFFGEGAGIAVRKEDTDLRETFNSALKSITADGTYDQINAKYFPFSIR